ncbi:MAG: 5-formyltetrahydrofolate cyclo-ligase [Eubacterium sp.]|nr:5-formyltetrahydrofolate cyclo-ligase [Eubacterium sp.]
MENNKDRKPESQEYNNDFNQLGDKSDIKKEIRRSVLQKRKSMDLALAKEYSDIICERIISLNPYKEAEVILSYMSFRNEVNMDKLMKDAINQGKEVYIPKVESGRRMEFYKFSGDGMGLVRGSYGILEPDTEKNLKIYKDAGRKTLMIVPGVAFDESLNRIGHGGGYYDVFLSMLGLNLDELVAEEGKTLGVKSYFTSLAVGYEYQIVDQIPADKYDIKPDYLVTEERVIKKI